MPALNAEVYFALALAYALAGTVLLGAAATLGGRRPGPRGAALTCALLLFVALAFHPLPDPSALRCPVPDTAPNLRPFAFMAKFFVPWPGDLDWRGWITWSGLSGAVMNLVLCAVIGGLLALYSLSRATILAAGLGLSLAVELTQLTAMWGLYPCAFRKFDLGDLLLNTVGVALGLLLVRGIRPKGSSRRRAGSAQR